MAKARIEELRRYYKQLKRLYDEKKGSSNIAYGIDIVAVDHFNSLIDSISAVMESDYSTYKVPASELRSVGYTKPHYLTEPVFSRMNMALGLLESELGIEDGVDGGNNNAITLINQNTIGINIQKTIVQLANEAEDDESREKLNELDKELKKPTKDWGKIKNVLIWILNFSEKLFFQILPELLKHYSG